MVRSGGFAGLVARGELDTTAEAEPTQLTMAEQDLDSYVIRLLDRVLAHN
jgi:hypothetical protein